MPEPDYDIPNEFTKFINDIYQDLYNQLLEDHGPGEDRRARLGAEAGRSGLMGFFNEHNRDDLERMTLDGWMGVRPHHFNKSAIRSAVFYEIIHDLKAIINELGETATPQMVTGILRMRFGIRSEAGRMKPKKHSRHRRSRRGRSRRGRSRRRR